MAIETGLILKALAGLTAASLVGTGAWYLATKDQVVWTDLDTKAFESTTGTWAWSLDPTEETITANQALTYTLTGTVDSKTWACKITGTLPNTVVAGATSGIRDQINGDFRTKTGFPNIQTSGSSATAWTKPADKSYAKNFFENCIRNRTKEEQTTASTEGTGAVTSTIKLNLKKETNENVTKYKFKGNQFENLYKGVVYSI